MGWASLGSVNPGWQTTHSSPCRTGVGGVAGIPALLSSLSPLPASRWGELWAQHRAAASRGRLLPPHTGAPCPPFSWHGSTALSGPFHHFGGYSVHILRWKYLSPVPTATPLDFPTPAPCPLQMGPTCTTMQDGDRPSLPRMWWEASPGAGMP